MTPISTDELARMADERDPIEVEIVTGPDGARCFVETQESIARRRAKAAQVASSKPPVSNPTHAPWMSWLGV